MKTNKISAFVAMAALLMGMASCQKDERVLNLKFENIGGSNAKVYIDRDDQNRCIPMWQNGDVVRVNNTNITLGSTNGAEATLLLPGSVTDVYSGIVASYPASSGTTSDSDCQSIRFSFPSTYTYNEVYKEGALYQKVNVPMVGHIEDLEGSSDMTMYNVCGMLRVNVTTDFDAFTVTSIVVLNEASQSLNGSNNITFNADDGKPNVSPKDGGSTSARTVTLNCGGKTVFGPDAVGHSEADRMVSFYIPMMPVVNAKLKITIVGYSNSNDGSAPKKEKLVKTQTENNTTIGRNQIKTAAITVSSSEVASEDIDQSVFSVSSTKRVRILSGNVRYNSVDGTWFVAPNAYDFVNTTSPDQNATIKDLFRCGFWWMDPIDMTKFYGTDVSHVVESNAKNYWTKDGNGNLTPHQSDLGGDWRLPTKEEIAYFANASRSNGPKYLRARIQTQSAPNGWANGMIIFPDQFAMPGGVPQIPFNLLNISVSTGNASNASHTYYGYQPTLCEYYSLTPEQWGYLQNAGCVFFPFPGYGNNSTSNSISSVGSIGYYHTTTPSATGLLYIFSYFSSSSYTTAAPNPYTRAAIRLVQDAN